MKTIAAASRTILFGFVAATLLAAFGGCMPRGEQPDVEDEIPGAVAAPRGLRFSVRVTPVRISPGDRVLLEASLFNDSDDEYEKKYRTHCIWDYEVTTTEGIPLRAARECVPQDSTMVLAPRELRMIVREWNGPDNYFNTAQPLAAGRYHIVAGFLDDGYRVMPMSAPVEIEIIERPRGR